MRRLSNLGVHCAGDEVLRCTAAQSPAGRMCLAQHVQHFLPATQLLRNKTGVYSTWLPCSTSPGTKRTVVDDL